MYNSSRSGPPHQPNPINPADLQVSFVLATAAQVQYDDNYSPLCTQPYNDGLFFQEASSPGALNEGPFDFFPFASLFFPFHGEGRGVRKGRTARRGAARGTRGVRMAPTGLALTSAHCNLTHNTNTNTEIETGTGTETGTETQTGTQTGTQTEPNPNGAEAFKSQVWVAACFVFFTVLITDTSLVSTTVSERGVSCVLPAILINFFGELG